MTMAMTSNVTSKPITVMPSTARKIRAPALEQGWLALTPHEHKVLHLCETCGMVLKIDAEGSKVAS